MASATWEMVSLLEALRGVLTQCGQVAIALQGHVDVEHKAADSEYQQSTAVTLADRLCQEIIMLRAAEAAPDLGIYCEELAVCPPEILDLFSGTSRYALAIDPIDGTDDYVARPADVWAHGGRARYGQRADRGRAGLLSPAGRYGSGASRARRVGGRGIARRTAAAGGGKADARRPR